MLDPRLWDGAGGSGLTLHLHPIHTCRSEAATATAPPGLRPRSASGSGRCSHRAKKGRREGPWSVQAWEFRALAGSKSLQCNATGQQGNLMGELGMEVEEMAPLRRLRPKQPFVGWRVQTQESKA